MLLGIVSDTHGHVAFARPAINMLAAWKVDEVIHCGDVGSAAIVRLFAAWPTHYVLGNCDRPEDEPALAAEIARAGHTLHGRFGQIERCGRRIAFLHGDDASCLAETIAGGQYDLVCYGHTHLAHQQQRGRTLVLNPGALYRAEPHSIAIVEVTVERAALKVTPLAL
jgi:putative phosphoesterase